MRTATKLALAAALLLAISTIVSARAEAAPAPEQEAEQPRPDVGKMTMEELLDEFHHPPEESRRLPAPQRRIDVINALRKLGDPLLTKMRADLANPDPKVKIAAVQVLGNLGNAARGAVPELVKAIDNENAEVRTWAVRVLGRLKDPRAFYPLIEATRDPSPRVRSAVLWTAYPYLSDSCFAVAAVALGDEDKLVRKRAVYRLKMLKDKRAVPLLIPLLEDIEVHHYNVRNGIKTASRNCDEVVLALEYLVNGQYVSASKTTQEENDRKMQEWRRWWKENGDQFVRELYAEPELRRSRE
ncbi:MAG: HEAT repeat domain-containing protein [Candidatus Nealsonbacteria bacterium]|nr:HEAT repeat domain-containing protein [Candidatus Nealsonbacteria bacterium]